MGGVSLVALTVPDDGDDAAVNAAVNALVDNVLAEEPETPAPTTPSEQQFHLLFVPAGWRGIDGIDKLIRVAASTSASARPPPGPPRYWAW